MLKKVKRGVCAVLILCLSGVGAPVFSADELTLDRETAIERLLNEGGLVEQMDRALSDFEDAYWPVRNAAAEQRSFQDDYNQIVSFMGDRLPDSFFLNHEEQFNSFYTMRIQEATLEAQYANLKLDRDRLRETAAAQIDSVLPTLLQLQALLEVQEARLALTQRELAGVSKKYALGQVSQNALAHKEKETAILEEEVAITTRQVENLELQLKKMLAIEVETPVQWRNSYRLMTHAPLEPVDTYIATALTGQTALLKAENRLEGDEKAHRLYREVYYNLTDRARAELTAQNSKQALETLKTEIEISVRDAYRDIEGKREALEVAKLRLENAQATYQTQRTQRASGQITALQLESAYLNTAMLQNEVMQALADYQLAVEQFITVNSKTTEGEGQ